MLAGSRPDRQCKLIYHGGVGGSRCYGSARSPSLSLIPVIVAAGVTLSETGEAGKSTEGG